MQEWEEELDTENMAEWWENDIHEEYPQEWLSDPIHIDDQYGWWKPSQPTQSAGDLWRSQRNLYMYETNLYFACGVAVVMLGIMGFDYLRNL